MSLLLLTIVSKKHYFETSAVTTGAFKNFPLGLERLFSGEEHVLTLQRTQVGFAASKLGSLQLQVTPGSGDLTSSSGLQGH